MRIDWDPAKEKKNKQKQGVGFSLAEPILRNPLALTIPDRIENGEQRWHTFAQVGDRVMLLVHTYPDPDDDLWIRVIGLRKAEPNERRRYEQDIGD